MANKTPITVAHGDGIGPEIMAAVLNILEAADAQIAPERIEVGEKVYLSGNTTGIPDEAWDSIERTKVLLKAPITTPQGGGYKSLNVTIRKTMGLYANVRPCKSLYPYVETKFPDIDLVIVRENEEDLYAGIEHRQTQEAVQCLKIFTRSGCERIVRYAFEYAKKYNRRKVTCMSKDNIMKMADGMFHQVFNEIAEEYPGFEVEHLIIDIGTALLAARPERFDVIVTSNLYGDIISDVAAQVAGSVGLAGSANIGPEVAMFEAIHGSAPDIAGQKIANPSGLLNGAVQMLNHIDQPKIAARIQNAWLRTIEDGIHTADIYNPRHSQQKVNTDEFAEAVIERLGQKPDSFPSVSYQSHNDQESANNKHKSKAQKPAQKELVGVDIFLDAKPDSIQDFCGQVAAIDGPLKLIAITNLGLLMWPGECRATKASDQWCCRYQASAEFSATDYQQVLKQIAVLHEAGFSAIKTENLYTYDGERGFSLAQGQ